MEGSPGKPWAPTSQAAAPSHTQPMLDKTLKWELLCSSLCSKSLTQYQQRSVEDVD